MRLSADQIRYTQWKLIRTNNKKSRKKTTGTTRVSSKIKRSRSNSLLQRRRVHRTLWWRTSSNRLSRKPERRCNRCSASWSYSSNKAARNSSASTSSAKRTFLVSLNPERVHLRQLTRCFYDTLCFWSQLLSASSSTMTQRWSSLPLPSSSLPQPS